MFSKAVKTMKTHTVFNITYNDDYLGALGGFMAVFSEDVRREL